MNYTADVVAHIIVIIVHTVLKETSARILRVRIGRKCIQVLHWRANSSISQTSTISKIVKFLFYPISHLNQSFKSQYLIQLFYLIVILFLQHVIDLTRNKSQNLQYYNGKQTIKRSVIQVYNGGVSFESEFLRRGNMGSTVFYRCDSKVPLAMYRNFSSTSGVCY